MKEPPINPCLPKIKGKFEKMSRSPFRALNKVDELYAPSNHDADVNLFQPTERSFSRNPTRLGQPHLLGERR
jgi:hypothetical protein